MEVINWVKEKVNNRILVPICRYLYYPLPIKKNRIVVDNFEGQGYGDNPRYITDKLLQSSRNLEIIWLVKDPDTIVPNDVRKVKYYTPEAMKCLATARVWIDNVKSFRKPLKKKNQFYLQTWHGGIGLKAVEALLPNINSKYKSTATRDAQQTDLMLSDSEWTTNIFHNFFWYDGEIQKTGFPRNDLLVNREATKDVKEKIFLAFGLDPKVRIVMYAPTFRDENDIDVYRYDFKRIRHALEQKFHHHYVIFIRLHPNLYRQGIVDSLYQFDNETIFDASGYNDMQELIAASDILISDFSSCIFDGLIAKKMVFLLAKDIENYVENDRELLFKVTELPFPFSNTEQAFLSTIANFDESKYDSVTAKFYESLKILEDGNASERVANIVLEKIGLQDET